MALYDMLESQTAKLRRLPAGLAYMRPALIAFKYGESEDLAEYWAGRARSVGSAQPPGLCRVCGCFSGIPSPGQPAIWFVRRSPPSGNCSKM